MKKMTFKTVILLVIVTLISITFFSCASDNTNISENFTAQITDKPLTFCNPITLNIGSERARRGGEPVVVLHQDEYYLFISGSRGYWISDNMRDWNFVEVTNLPGGCPSVVSAGDKMYYSGDKSRHEVMVSTDPKNGVWEQVGLYDRDYGDADLFMDDDGRFYMYWGWSQLLPFQVVELDPDNGFTEIGEPRTLFFGDAEKHGFERKRKADLIFPYISYRDYLPEESPWIEGPWMMKYNGTYYLQYAAIGLEFSTYSHGIYTADNPLGPFVYSPHNPLTFKTTGYVLGAGHGSTFQDKNGQFWTIAMVPTFFGGRGGSEVSFFPTAVDADGVMHSNTAFGDYPQYYPGVKDNAVDNGFTGWLLLSNKKYVEVSSALEGYDARNASDENFLTFWCAETGDPGEYMTMDLGKECDIYALQINFDQHEANVAFGGRGMGAPAPAASGNTRYQSFTVQTSNDNQNWSMLIDKSNKTMDDIHNYTELQEPVKARYVKVTNVFTPSEGKFAIKDLRIFGNPDVSTFTAVDNVMVVRHPEDLRDVTLTWQPVAGADGYVIRYGIESDKLYNSYMVYEGYTLTMHSLNRDEDYYFEVEAFDSGTDYYEENIAQTMGLGAEIDLMRGREQVKKIPIFEGKNEYVVENITPGEYSLNHALGPMMWRGELTEAHLIGSGGQPTITEILSDLGFGTEVLGKMEFKVIPGEDSGKIVVTFIYD
ncbi:family 43 glycosylhydrolase [Candidatus Latescibacterota bacterium]